MALALIVSKPYRGSSNEISSVEVGYALRVAEELDSTPPACIAGQLSRKRMERWSIPSHHDRRVARVELSHPAHPSTYQSSRFTDASSFKHARTMGMPIRDTTRSSPCRFCSVQQPVETLVSPRVFAIPPVWSRRSA